MEAVTAPSGTGSKTMADLLGIAAERYAGQTALKHKVGDEWVGVGYDDLGIAVREIALGLIDLGL
jgi:long-chain acyl-CoA synthetase